jgi:hypothetical protein
MRRSSPVAGRSRWLKPCSDRGIVDLDEQIEQQYAGLGERGAPGRAKQRVGEIASLG